MKLMPNDERSISYTDYGKILLHFEIFLQKDHFAFEGIERFDEFLKGANTRCLSYEFAVNTAATHCINALNDLRNQWLYGYTLNVYQENLTDINDSSGNSLNSYSRRAYEKSDYRTHQELHFFIKKLDSRTFFSGKKKRKGIIFCLPYLSSSTIKFDLIAPVVPLKDLEPDSSLGELDLPLYVQVHAINRIIERLNVKPYNALVIIANAIKDHEVTPLGNNQYLLACFVRDKKQLKCGYILIELTEDHLLIRTFLLLTNSGTPEGEMLEKQTGLQKKDKEYFKIDNIEGLIQSDILENEAVCNIFENAGCGSLLEICRRSSMNKDLYGVFSRATEDDEFKNKINKFSDFLLKHIKKEDDELPLKD